jgi:hypothetical protein
MTILHSDTDFGDMPTTRRYPRTLYGVDGAFRRTQQYADPITRPHRASIPGGWRSVATAVVLGVALAATLFFTLSN